MKFSALVQKRNQTKLKQKKKDCRILSIPIILFYTTHRGKPILAAIRLPVRRILHDPCPFAIYDGEYWLWQYSIIYYYYAQWNNEFTCQSKNSEEVPEKVHFRFVWLPFRILIRGPMHIIVRTAVSDTRYNLDWQQLFCFHFIQTNQSHKIYHTRIASLWQSNICIVCFLHSQQKYMCHVQGRGR